MDQDDPSRFKFFANMKRAERERLERYHGDVEERKRWILRCASGGGMQNVKRRNAMKKITVAPLSWTKND